MAADAATTAPSSSSGSRGPVGLAVSTFVRALMAWTILVRPSFKSMAANTAREVGAVSVSPDGQWLHEGGTIGLQRCSGADTRELEDVRRAVFILVSVAADMPCMTQVATAATQWLRGN